MTDQIILTTHCWSMQTVNLTMLLETMRVTLTDSTLMRRGASNKHAISRSPIGRPNRRSTLQTLRPPEQL